jgi:two-component system sensor histidine kinase QseC
VRDGVARATHTVHQLLALERTQSQSAQDAECQLTEVAEFARERLAAAGHLAMQRNIDMEFMADTDACLPLHVESMAAAIDNLISNAIKYSPPDGKIVMRLGAADAGGATLRWSITDQGPGIEPALREKVFERFYRVPGQAQLGTGLGLAIAERGAERNRGAILLSDGDNGCGLTAAIEFEGCACAPALRLD